jgi:hypothetical protein
VANVNWSEDGKGQRLSPGIYRCELRGCTEKMSANGNAMFAVKLHALDIPGHPLLAFDNIMLSGKGRYFGTRKLAALGFSQTQTEIQAYELEGRPFYAAVIEESYQGKTRLKVNVEEPGSASGYWQHEPAGYVAPAVQPAAPAVDEVEDIDNVPF